MANIIYGINAGAGFTDIIDLDAALETLGLKPSDLSTINDISSFINIDELHTLSQVSGSPNTIFPTTAIEKISQRIESTERLPLILESKALVSRPSTTGIPTESIQGNVIVNGPIGAPAIRYFSTELMNADTGEFEPLDISTSRVSSWSRNGSTITYGGDLRLSSVSPREAFDRGNPTGAGIHATPRLGVGKLIVDGKVQKTNISQRLFTAEQATHKLKVNINGEDVYLFAMKNIPLVFEGTFEGGANPIVETSSTTGNADYQVITGNIAEPFNASTNGDNGDLIYSGRGITSRTIELYQAPAKLTILNAPNLNIRNFPNAEFDNLQELDFSDNVLKKLPNFKKLCSKGNLTKLILEGNNFFESPVGSIKAFNRFSFEAINRIPESVSEFNIASCFAPRGGGAQTRIFSADFKRQLPNLTQLKIGNNQLRAVNSPFYPEVAPSTAKVIYNELEGMYFPGISQSKTIPLGGGYKRLNNDTSVKHNTALSFVGNGPHSLLKIRRSMNLFSVEVNSPGGDYTEGTHSFVVTKPERGPVGTIGSITNNGNDSNRTADLAAADYATTTNGNGTGALLNISTDANGAATVALSSTTGDGYELGDTLIVDNALLGDTGNLSSNIEVIVETIGQSAGDVVNIGCAGAFSPQGIPFGTITIKVDSAGKIKTIAPDKPTFLPHNSPDVFAKSIITIPNTNGYLDGQPTKDVQVHLGGAFSGYSPMGYYVDCGLFSSPLGIKTIEVIDSRAFLFHKHDAYQNPFVNESSVTNLGNTATYTSNIEGGAPVPVNKPDHNVYKNFEIFRGNFSRGLTIPNFKGCTNLKTFSMQRAPLIGASNTSWSEPINKMKKFRDIIKLAPGLDCPSEAELAYLWGRGRTLYDSPKDSPAQPADGIQGAQSSIRGKNGTYKFEGCSSLESLDFTRSAIGGTLPSFTGNTSLKEILLNNTYINRGEAGDGDSPLFLKREAFDSCKDTLVKFDFRVNGQRGQWQTDAAILAGDMWGWHNGKFAPPTRGGTDTRTYLSRLDPFPLCTLKEAEVADSNSVPQIEKGDTCFDILGNNLTHVFLRTRSGVDDSRANRGLSGRVPTFKNASNLKYIYLASNALGMDPTESRPDSIKAALGADSMDFSYQYDKLTYLNFGANNITGNLSFQRIANGSTNLGGANHFPVLQHFYMYWNYLTGITDWGADGVQYNSLAQLHFANAFQPRAGGYNRNNTSNELTLPSMKDKFPRLAKLRLQGYARGGAGSQGILGFDDSAGTTFRGMTRLSEIDLSYNRLTKAEILNVLTALRNLCRDEGVRGVTIKLAFQKDYDGTDGFTDFRLGIASDIDAFRQAGQGNSSLYPGDWSITDGWGDTGQSNDIAMNDMIEELTNRAIYNCELNGVRHSTVPQAPDAPTTLEYLFTGPANNQLQSTRLTKPGGGNINLFQYPATSINGTISVSGIDQDTESINIKFLNYRGVQLEDYEINVTRNQMENDVGNTLRFSQGLNLPINGNNQVINKFDTTSPYDLNTTLASDVTDYSNNKQAFSIICTPTGYRGDGQPKIVTYQFINQEQFVAEDDSDYEGAREWRTLQS